jgi:hypothetical protein
VPFEVTDAADYESYSFKKLDTKDAKTKERVLVKSKEEFTSLIQKLYKVETDFIIITENSIYLASGKIQKRRIQAASLRNAVEELEA